MWSLAVEEQFYLVWPVTALVLLRRFRSPRALLVVAALGGVVSMIAMALLFHPGHDPSRAYYGTDARAHTILIGVAVAVLLLGRAYEAPRSRSRPLELAGVVGALFLVWACVSVDGQRAFLYRGGSALVAMATAAVIASVVTERLSPPPCPHPVAAPVGLRGPDLLRPLPVALADRAGPHPGAHGLDRHPLLGVRVLATFAIAYLSWSLVEMPIRRGALRTRRPGVLAPVAVVLTIVVLLVTTLPTRVLPPGSSARPPRHPCRRASSNDRVRRCAHCCWATPSRSPMRPVSTCRPRSPGST